MNAVINDVGQEREDESKDDEDASQVSGAGSAAAELTTFAIIRLQSVKAVVVDSVLGLHLPLAQVC